MKVIATLIAVFVVAVTTQAQSPAGKISLSVLNDKNAGVDNAIASLLKSNNKQIVKTTLADKEGKIIFENISAGTYRIHLSATGFEEVTTDSIVINESNHVISWPSVILYKKDIAQLKEVTVSAKKPFIQRMNDRIIVNVDNSVVNAGSSAFEVLERSPGVTIDPNDNIALKGKQGVIIMVDGKPSPMTGADLVNYLRGLPGNSIDRIEIITNPSSKYDAAGNSGIIDIKLKKDQRLGSNGSFNAGYGQGVYPKANAGLSLN
ncbi:MAG TPA: TonB-dependent receptor, partial [Ferruginibacter sp.]|nr:TonB-dependent receptor [Ferruginibacter sp.]